MCTSSARLSVQPAHPTHYQNDSSGYDGKAVQVAIEAAAEYVDYGSVEKHGKLQTIMTAVSRYVLTQGPAVTALNQSIGHNSERAPSVYLVLLGSASC